MKSYIKQNGVPDFNFTLYINGMDIMSSNCTNKHNMLISTIAAHNIIIQYAAHYQKMLSKLEENFLEFSFY